MNISFASTTPALLAGHKSVTRRSWSSRTEKIARKVCDSGDPVMAYDKSTRNGGKPVAIIKLTSVYVETLIDMPDTDYVAEGFEWMWLNGKVPKVDPWHIETDAPRYSMRWFRAAQESDMNFTVVRFLLLRVL